jgi:catechol 2,3-dioxygenase-like lactoylglutathione lyase family enzyme
MHAYAAVKLDAYKNGKLSRRQLLESLTVAVAASAATGSANAASTPRALQAALVNHISITCPNFRQAADWYSKVFNLEQITYPSEPTQIGIPFGPKGSKPMGVTADDVPVSYLVVRTRDSFAPAANGVARRRPRASIEHIGYTVADFDREKAKVELRALGVQNVRDGGLYSLHMDDPFGYDIQLSGVANNALTDGA